VSTGKTPRVVIISRPTEYEVLLGRHTTLGQVRFYLESRGHSLGGLQQRQDEQLSALQSVEGAIPATWRRSRVRRADLDRFLFEPEDIVVAVGQDGLVANSAKYLNGQPVIGINPSPERNAGVLVPHPPDAIQDLLPATEAGAVNFDERSMARARMGDGRTLLALNEVFIGHSSHQSARYRIHWREQEERQSSSGLIVSTGTGATGWARSIHQERRSALELPEPSEAALIFFVREAWPSVATGTTLTEGSFSAGTQLEVLSEMERGGVIFADGIESDRLEFLWGQRVQIGIADTRLRLVAG
jgi:hypothetical protein